MSNDGKDDLLKEAELLQEQVSSPQAPSTRRQAWKKIPDAIKRGWRHRINILGPILRLYWRFCKKVFKWLSYKNGSLSIPRALAVCVALVVFSWTLVLHAIPFTARLVYDVSAVELFSYQEALIFSKPEQIGDTGVYNVFACRQSPCNGSTDSVEFRIRDSIWLDIKRVLTKFDIHDPAEIAGAFLSEENACVITAYGRRAKLLGWYPYVINAICKPVNGDNGEQILENLRQTLLNK